MANKKINLTVSNEQGQALELTVTVEDKGVKVELKPTLNGKPAPEDMEVDDALGAFRHVLMFASNLQETLEELDDDRVVH